MKLERRPIKAEVSTRVELHWEPGEEGALVVAQRPTRGSIRIPVDYQVAALYLEYRWALGAWQGRFLARGWRVLGPGRFHTVTTMLHEGLCPDGWPAELEALLEQHHPPVAMRVEAQHAIEKLEHAPFPDWPVDPGIEASVVLTIEAKL